MILFTLQLYKAHVRMLKKHLCILSYH